MKVFRMAAVIVLMASPAYAQMPAMNLLMDNKPSKTQDEKDAEAARDKAYQNSLKKIPDAKPADPWGNVRSDAPKTDAPKTVAKASAKPKTKAGSSSTAN